MDMAQRATQDPAGPEQESLCLPTKRVGQAVSEGSVAMVVDAPRRRILVNTLSGLDGYRWRRVRPKSLRTPRVTRPRQRMASTRAGNRLESDWSCALATGLSQQTTEGHDVKRGYP